MTDESKTADSQPREGGNAATDDTAKIKSPIGAGSPRLANEETVKMESPLGGGETNEAAAPSGQASEETIKSNSPLDGGMPQDIPMSVNAVPISPHVVPQTSYYVYRDRHSDGTVGFFTLIGLMILFGSYCWWKSFSPLHPYQRFHLHFHDVAGMNPQAAIFVNGVRVGTVEKIAVVDPTTVDVGVRISTTKIRIPTGSQFMILPNGVVGAKYIEIILPSNSSNAKYLDEKSISWGEDPVRPEIVVNELAEKLSNLDFDSVQEKLSKGMDQMTYAAQRVSTLSRKLEPAAEKLAPVAERAAVAEDTVTALAKDMRAPVQQMHQIMDQKHPLLHMIFGRPGHIKSEEKVNATSKDGTVVDKKSKVEVTTNDSDTDEKKEKKEKKKKHKKHHKDDQES